MNIKILANQCFNLVKFGYVLPKIANTGLRVWEKGKKS